MYQLQLFSWSHRNCNTGFSILQCRKHFWLILNKSFFCNKNWIYNKIFFSFLFSDSSISLFFFPFSSAPIHVPVTLIPLVHSCSNRSSREEGEMMKRGGQTREGELQGVCVCRGGWNEERVRDTRRLCGARRDEEEQDRLTNREEGTKCSLSLSIGKPFKVKLAWRISGQTECVCDHPRPTPTSSQRDDSTSFTLRAPLPSGPSTFVNSKHSNAVM